LFHGLDWTNVFLPICSNRGPKLWIETTRKNVKNMQQAFIDVYRKDVRDDCNHAANCHDDHLLIPTSTRKWCRSSCANSSLNAAGRSLHHRKKNIASVAAAMCGCTWFLPTKSSPMQEHGNRWIIRPMEVWGRYGWKVQLWTRSESKLWRI